MITSWGTASPWCSPRSSSARFLLLVSYLNSSPPPVLCHTTTYDLENIFYRVSALGSYEMQDHGEHNDKGLAHGDDDGEGPHVEGVEGHHRAGEQTVIVAPLGLGKINPDHGKVMPHRGQEDLSPIGVVWHNAPHPEQKKGHKDNPRGKNARVVWGVRGATGLQSNLDI